METKKLEINDYVFSLIKGAYDHFVLCENKKEELIKIYDDDWEDEYYVWENNLQINSDDNIDWNYVREIYKYIDEFYDTVAFKKMKGDWEDDMWVELLELQERLYKQKDDTNFDVTMVKEFIDFFNFLQYYHEKLVSIQKIPWKEGDIPISWYYDSRKRKMFLTYTIDGLSPLKFDMDDMDIEELILTLPE